MQRSAPVRVRKGVLVPSGTLRGGAGDLYPVFHAAGLQLASEKHVSVRIGMLEGHLASLFQGKLARQSGSDTLWERERGKSLPDEDGGCNTESVMTGKTGANPFRGLLRKVLVLHRDHICFPGVEMGIRAM